MQGKRKDQHQPDLFLTYADIPQNPGHTFYDLLNQVFAEAGFDAFVQKRCKKYYADEGRPGIPPEVYFRMMLVGFFEGIESQRGIVWRCTDSLSLRSFLGLSLTESVPDHSSMTRIRQRLDLKVYHEVFGFILGLLRRQKLVHGKRLAIDSTPIKANASMRSLRHRVSGKDWEEYVLDLAAQEGKTIETPEDRQRYDRQRKGKRVSNQEWESESDPDSGVTPMKDGSTHLAYKVEHVVDLDTDAIVVAQVYRGEAADSVTGLDTLACAAEQLEEIECENDDLAVAADKGYYSLENVSALEECEVHTYLKEPRVRGGRRRWQGKEQGRQASCYRNRHRNESQTGRQMHAHRQEKVERSFAHTCETGGGRRTWLRGLEQVAKERLMKAVGFNLTVLMRELFGFGKPRTLQGLKMALLTVFGVVSAQGAWWYRRFTVTTHRRWCPAS